MLLCNVWKMDGFNYDIHVSEWLHLSLGLVGNSDMTSNMRNYYHNLSYSSKYVEKSYETYIQQALTNNSYSLFYYIDIQGKMIIICII